MSNRTMYRTLAGGLLMTALVSGPATAASSRFGMAYHVERIDARALSLGKCLATVQRASAAIGYVGALQQTTPGRLSVFASGPREGGRALTVYCIAVANQTTYVVQAVDYNRPDAAVVQRAADAVNGALLRAAGR